MENKERLSYVSYIDTDSLFLRVGFFLERQGVDISIWDNLDKDVKIKFLLKLSKYIENNINDRMYEETQLQDYTSNVDKDDFAINFKQEIVCSNALHIAPKMYAFHVINDEGFDCDEVKAKGIETVRSSSPRVFRNALKSMIRLILSGASDEDIIQLIADKVVEFYSAPPEHISVNIGVNGISKYRDGKYSYIKGTPYQVKGAINYMFLLDKLELNHKFEQIHEGDKCRFTYTKKNKWNIDGITYFDWPKEFNEAGIIPDYDIQIEKYFIGKARILLEPLRKEHLLETSNNAEADFF